MNTADFLVVWLSKKLNEEMQNILNKELTKEEKRDIMALSNEREVKTD